METHRDPSTDTVDGIGDGIGDGEAAARALWGDAGVRVIPGEYLAREADGYHPGAGYIRLALVHDLETTREALTRITQVL